MAGAPTPPRIRTPPPTDGGARADPPPPPRDARARLSRLAPVGIGAAVTLAAVFLFNLLTPKAAPLTERQVDEAIANALASQTAPPAYAQIVYQAVQPSLVLIQTEGVADPNATDPDEHDGLGSGVVVNRAGDILTSLHVVEGAADIKVTFADGSTSEAEMLGSQPENDIAVLRARQPPAILVPATLGNPAAVRQGTEAYALGSPFGLYGSVSAGVISGLDRSFTMPNSDRTLTGLFQIDAAVNPGNSGGALVDRSGRVIVTALINPTDDDVFIGIGLAVPIDVAGGAAGLPPY
jgi:S1-C subfamily serine protease